MIEQIWKKYQQELYNYIYARVQEKSIADDLLQDVFVKVQTKLDQLKNTSKTRAWLFQLTRNTVIDFYRMHSRTTNQEIEEEILLEESENHFDDLHTCVVPIIKTLPKDYQNALLLSEINGLSQKELAEQMKISYSAAKSRVQRGRSLLKNALNKCGSFQHDEKGKLIDYEKKKASCSICEH